PEIRRKLPRCCHHSHLSVRLETPSNSESFNMPLRRITAPGNRDHVTAELLRENSSHSNILPPRPSQIPDVSCHLPMHQPQCPQGPPKGAEPTVADAGLAIPRMAAKATRSPRRRRPETTSAVRRANPMERLLVYTA